MVVLPSLVSSPNGEPGRSPIITVQLQGSLDQPSRPNSPPGCLQLIACRASGDEMKWLDKLQNSCWLDGAQGPTQHSRWVGQGGLAGFMNKKLIPSHAVSNHSRISCQTCSRKDWNTGLSTYLDWQCLWPITLLRQSRLVNTHWFWSWWEVSIIIDHRNLDIQLLGMCHWHWIGWDKTRNYLWKISTLNGPSECKQNFAATCSRSPIQSIHTRRGAVEVSFINQETESRNTWQRMLLCFYTLFTKDSYLWEV